MGNIDFGIDLGTTNSGIGKYENGRVQVLKNPVGLREVLPSVVSFYKDRILVGDKAREQYLSNSGNVFSAFKRKMGTSETYEVSWQRQLQRISPVDLSAYVLKELKNYVHGNEIEAVVITIPASFDTIQSNATKQAGYQAGFKEVILLQEPVAACLAYANLSHLDIESEQKWLVYDFGGKTFDAALVYINARELKVIDNKGNNFLGGVDIDHAFINQLIVPELSKITGDAELLSKLVSKEEAVYDKLWHYLNYLAEEAKKQLSVSRATWLEIDFPDLDILTDLKIEREDFDRIVKPRYKQSEQLILELLKTNNLNFTDIERIILVGGTTYIPFIKDALKSTSANIVDDTIDPTTAVIVGAAFYAGTHPTTAVDVQPQITEAAKPAIDIRVSYEPYSNDKEELIAFKVPAPFNGYYRITRLDGGFDSGLQAFSVTASEFVSLLPKTRNIFKLSLFDNRQQLLYEEADIAISHGFYSVSGQLLPEDICIELDRDDNNTYLEVIFKRNSILPLTKTLYKTFSKSIVKNTEDRIIINVVEGRGGTLPGANLSIGYIEISGKQIEADLIQSTDIEIQVQMDDSRGLEVEVFIPSTGQQMSQGFHLANREVNVSKLLLDVALAQGMAANEIELSNKKETYELSAMFQRIADELALLKIALIEISSDLVTAEKYRLDDKKRHLLSELDSLTRSRDVYTEIKFYKEQQERFDLQQQHANETQKKMAADIINRQKDFLQSGDKHLIKKETDSLKKISDQITLQNDETYISLFFTLIMYPELCFKERFNKEELVDAGRQALKDKDYKQLKQIVAVFISQLKDEWKKRPDLQSKYPSDLKNFKTGLK
jgi:molecular chaperone DnaK